MRVLLSSCLFLLIIFSCNKTPEEATPLEEGHISVSRIAIRLDTAINSIDTFTIQSEVGWAATISPLPAWIKLSRTAGNAGSTVDTIKVLSNAGTSTRTATIRLEARSYNADPIEITITQKPYEINPGWKTTLGGSDVEIPSSILKTSDGGYILAGVTQSSNGDITGYHGGADIWVVKLDATGIKQWAKAYGGTGHDDAFSIIATSDGGYLVAGSSTSTDGDFTDNKGQDDVALLKLDANGNKLWSKTYGGTAIESAAGLVATSDGGYVVLANTMSNDGDVTGQHGLSDVWILKVDDTGTKQWARTFGGSSYEDGNSILQVTGGGFIIAGHSQSSDGDATGNRGGSDVWVIKLDETGTKLWTRNYGGTGTDQARSIAAVNGGGYVIAGYAISVDGDVSGNHGGHDMWVLKINESGDKQWERALGGTAFDDGRSIATTADGGFIVVGTNSINSGDVTDNRGGHDMWVVKLNAAGIKIWSKSFGGSGFDDGYLIISSGSDFILSGYTTSNDGDVSGNHGQGDIWVAKISEN